MLQEEGVGASEVQYRRSLDMRYLGQENFINVPLQSGRAIDPKIVRDTFETTYRSLFGHSNLSEQVEIVNLRLAAHGPLPVTASRGVQHLGRCRRCRRDRYAHGDLRRTEGGHPLSWP